jgi:hypothetical protein
MEPQYRSGKRRIRPFANSANASARGCSRPLQRVLSDFGADLSWARVMDKVVEHYGVVICESTIRRVTLKHAKKMHTQSQGAPLGMPDKAPTQNVIIVQTDGSMIPTVRSKTDAQDKRKGKSVQWQEVKLSLAHVHESKELSYAATLQGEVNGVGRQLRACARRVGMTAEHRVHAMGDGAPWIANQVKKRFGAQGSYLVDFYHVCEYLVQAAAGIQSQPAAQQQWLEEQKHKLKTGQLDAVLMTLQAHQEEQACADEDAPVRRCWRYLSHRQDQLDYAGAISKGLPIGSGEIESAHRYIIQRRLKIAGAWWNETNAEHMLALRLNRANAEWNGYWACNYRYAEAA